MVVVRLARRRTRAAILMRAEVGAPLQGAGRQPMLIGIARPGGQDVYVCGNVVDDPMPPAAARGRVRIVNHESEALRTGRRVAPAQRRRNILSGAAKRIVDLCRSDFVSLHDIGTRKLKGTCLT